MLASACSASRAVAQAAPADRIYFTRLAPSSSGLFIADLDGANERPLLPATSLDYNGSFSVDMKWIVFTSERAGSADIYRVHPDGAGLEQLTDSPWFDDQGALSPDGRSLAFVSTRSGAVAHLWLMDLATHQYRQLTRGAGGDFRPSWSPDGRWLAFTSDRDAPHRRTTSSFELNHFTALYVIRARGDGLKRLTAMGQLVMSPRWSADGRRIVFARRQVDGASGEIISVDVESGAEKIELTGKRLESPQILPDGDIGYEVSGGYLKDGPVAYLSGRKGGPLHAHRPAWSADGKSVVYDRALSAVPPYDSPYALGPGSAPVLPVYSMNPRVQLFRTGSFATFSPDGSRMLIAGNAGRPPDGRGFLVMDADGSHPRTLFEDPKATVTSPSWSPDGKLIAFGMGVFFERPAKPAQLAVMNADGSGLRMLTGGASSSAFPSFSPDGKRLVYRVLGGAQGLRILSLDDGGIKDLTSGWDNFPAWSPCGDVIAFTRQVKSGDFEIFTVHADGSQLRQLTHDHGNDAHESWSPDGKWLLFTSSRRGWKDEDQGFQAYGELFMMRADGTRLTQLTDNQWEDATGSWLGAAGARSLREPRALCAR